MTPTLRSAADAPAAASVTVRPGALTNLIAALVRADPGPGWDAPLLEGEVIGGRFEIAREMGRGGFGVVYEAHDRALSRAVAFKAIHASAGVRDERLVAEAEAAAQLAHPNIVHLYDVGRDVRGAYLIMELLRGETLADRLARGSLTVREAVRVLAELSRGVAHAHAHGVVHRDLKPGNVFLCDDGQVKVLDFGMAHVFARRGPAGGTPGYMAPEQARGEPGDARVDVFALGVMLREALGGGRPGRPGRPHAAARRAPAQLSTLVARMIAADPSSRPADARDVLGALATIQRKLEPRRLLWTAWGVAGLALAVAAVVALRSRAPLPPGRLVVAMADTVNGTGDPDLDGVGALLATALEQSRRVSLLARSRVFGWARDTQGAAPARVDEELATAAARSLHAQALFVPSVHRVGEALDVELRAVDVTRGEPLFTVRERAASKAVVVPTLDRVSTRSRAALGETAAEAPRTTFAVADLTTSAEALRHYAEAKRLESEARADDAVAEYERALAADPEFPLAHAELAVRAGFVDNAAAQAHFEAALRHADRLPAKERMLVEARRFQIEGRPDDALARWDAVIAGWPQDPVAYALAGTTLLSWYPDAVAARPYLEKAVELSALAPGEAIDALVALGRLDEALARARRWVEASPGPGSFLNLSFVHRMRGERKEALDSARRVLSYGWLPGSGFAGDHRSPTAFWSYVDADAVDEIDRAYRARGLRSWETLALRGRLRDAIAMLDEEFRGAEQRSVRAAHHGLRGNLLWGTGDADAVWHEMEQELLLGSARVMCSSHLLVSLGDLDRSALLMNLWAHSAAANPRMYCPGLYRHVREWKQGDAETAARGLAGMFGPEPTYFRALVLLDAGRDQDAVEALRQFRRDPAFNFDAANVIAWPRSLYLEAAALERLGKRDEALRILDRLLALWRSAEEDVAYLREAKLLHARLGSPQR